MLKEIITSFQAYYQTHRFIIKHRLWKWILIPGFIYAVLFCLGIYLFVVSSNSAIEFMLQKSGVAEWMEKMQNSWLSFLLIFGQIILNLVLLLFYFSLFKYLFLIIGSPLFAYLSEKTASIMEGKDYPFNFKQLMKDIMRGIRLALRNMLWQTVYTVSILILSFIPLIGWVTPLLALLVECYYLGFSMLDYSCERNKLSTSQSITFIGRHKGLAIGNGMVFYLMHFIPVLGWLLAPSYAVIAATISLYKARNEGLINVAGKVNL
ncbi:MAG: EI24 domain-containing protein [Chitinophagaceae bacterium]|nr:EI24 domain-containing protein [Chitinophagaceae bacterium]MBK7122735.1 EI24 domain-containing protein [Chitinophagaceae bacterium]MBK7557800.1 EI24 domain-containing protein [Chitinophagaceae bacterium]MBK9531482.1 EI24 domain-containing protein [Chitinophagaceae bacterium]HQW91843.1 EI24 domain-containing protein [Ferruginibacter sp.]